MSHDRRCFPQAPSGFVPRCATPPMFVSMTTSTGPPVMMRCSTSSRRIKNQAAATIDRRVLDDIETAIAWRSEQSTAAIAQLRAKKPRRRDDDRGQHDECDDPAQHDLVLLSAVSRLRRLRQRSSMPRSHRLVATTNALNSLYYCTRHRRCRSAPMPFARRRGVTRAHDTAQREMCRQRARDTSCAFVVRTHRARAVRAARCFPRIAIAARSHRRRRSRVAFSFYPKLTAMDELLVSPETISNSFFAVSPAAVADRRDVHIATATSVPDVDARWSKYL